MYLFTAVADKPLGLWPLSDTSPFDDFSGYNRSGSVVSGVTVQPAPLVSQISKSTIFTNAVQGTFASPVFLQGQENSNFTLEAWILPIETANVEQAILGHQGQYDGLLINGTTLSFVTKYSTTGESRASFNLVRKRAVHVVGIHTSEKNSLYINGELASEAEITEEQQADTYAHSTSALLSGYSTGAGSFAANCIAVYAGVLSHERVIAHFEAGRNVEPAASIAEYYDSQRFLLTAEEAEVFLETVWSTDLDWNGGLVTDITVMENMMIPDEDETGVSKAGTWLDSFALDTADTPIYGVQVDWIGEGAVVEASLDGTTWETVARGTSLSLITPGFDPTDQELELRVTFPGGVANDTSYISQLLVTGFDSNPLPDVEDRVITATAPVWFGREYEPIEYREDYGVRLSGGTITIGPDVSDDLIQPRTVELWVKKRTTTAPAISATGTVYVNGVAANLSALRVNEWSLVHIVTAAGISTDLTISGLIDVGQVVLYTDALSATQIADIFSNFTGRTTLVPPTVSTVDMSQPAEAANLYTHDWSITGGGA